MGIIKVVLWVLILNLAFVSCSNSKDGSVNKEELSAMIDGYYYYFGEYPSSIDSLITYYDNLDSSNATISFLKNKRNNILWNLYNPSVLQEKMVVKYTNDTLYYHQGEKRLSYLDNLIDNYEQAYLQYPQSLEDLIRFNAATKDLKKDLFDRCITRTLIYLQNFDEQIEWISDDELFLILSDNDTIDCRIGPSYHNIICSSNNWYEKNVFLFYDEHNVYVPNKELTIELKRELQNIRKDYKLENYDISDYHILNYTIQEGLQRFCKDDDISLNTEWFYDVEILLRSFCNEHGLVKVIFVSPSYQI